MNKYIMLFEKFISDNVLYHGSLNRFKEFKNQTMYFTDDEQFAHEYADMKAMDMAIDNSPIIYTVKATGNIFDIENKEDYDKLYNSLPDKVTFGHRSMGFITATVSKDEIMEYLKGYETIEPDEKIISLNVGDTFPSPQYHLDEYIVVKKDEDYVTALDNKSMKRDIAKLLSTRSYSDGGVFKPLKDFVKKVINDTFPNKYVDDDTKSLIDNYIQGSRIPDYLDDFSDKIENIDGLRKEYKRLYDESYPLFIEERLKKRYGKRYVNKTTKSKLEETWTYYENEDVADTIKKLGYNGYKATERYSGTTYNTFAIFNPNETVKIINIS